MHCRRMARHARTPFDLAAGFGAAAVHAGVTLWWRWPVLMAASTSEITAREADELNRMVTEKLAAATTGLIDSQAAMMRLALSAMSGGLGRKAIAQAPTRIVDAATRPALRKVRANARRLTRRK